MNNFVKRTITGSLFVIITVALIVINEWTFLTFLLIANIWLSFEFLRLSSTEIIKPNFITTILTGTLAILMVFLNNYCCFDHGLYWIILLFVMLIFIEELFRKNENPLQNISVSVLSLVYISLPLVISVLLVKGNLFYYQIGSGFNPGVLLGILILIWIFDSMAYCMGTLFGKKGKHKLFERISPKKSWEGTIGGAIFAIIAGYFICLLFPVLSRLDWLVISAIIIVFGTLGDLIESMFKRSSHIKDSGHLLPGHGGLLDRLDSFIFTVPWVFFYLLLKESYLICVC